MMQMSCLSLPLLCTLLVCGDCWAKCCASQVINALPYARKEEESKAKVVYNRMSHREFVINLASGLLPACLWLPHRLWWACLGSLLVLLLLLHIMKRRLQGYTGDCCGATFLLCELTFYLCSLILI